MRIKLSVKTIMGVGLLHLLVGLPGYARADLVGYWPFDEGQGTVAADVTGGNHGEITGSTWLLPGKMGNAALEFTANGNYVNCGPDVTSGPDITVAFWMKANNLAYCQPLLASAGDYATVPGWRAMLRLEGGVWFRIEGSDAGGWPGGDLHITDTVYEVGTWVHMTFTFDSESRELKGYVNGELKGTATVAEGRTIANSTQDLICGAAASTGYRGSLDEVAIWNTPLTPEEIKLVYTFRPDAFDFQPAPAHESIVFTNAVHRLKWTNMPPNTQDGDVYAAVWFMRPGGTMNRVLVPNDQAAKNATSFGPINTSLEGTYTWRIDSYLNGPDNINESNRVEGNLYTFTVTADPGPEITNMTANQMTWSGKEIPLAVTTTNQGPSETIYNWTYSTDPAADVSIIDTDTATPKVTITKLADPPAIQTVTLSVEVSDAVNPTPKIASMVIDVYDNACEMAKLGEGIVVPTDFNGDCVTNLEDFAQLAIVWLQNYFSTGPMDLGVATHFRGLHGYIGYSSSKPPNDQQYNKGMGFYSAAWPLIDQPIAHFQIGLASTWILPDNSDNIDQPLAPIGTRARNWPERGPTWSSVFQTVEGGLGYWAGNHFRYGPPKFSMNATPQCYDYEVGSPGWSFFYTNEALPDNRLGIAQLSNRVLIPPDAIPLEGNPNGKFLGYTYMALPFTDPTTGDPPTGDQSWTCFLSTANFKGPIAYYIPETWSKIGKIFNYPFIYGRGLDARPGLMGGGAIEIGMVPCLESKDKNGTVYTKIPKLQFPVDAQGNAILVQDVVYYSKDALYNEFKTWRDGGKACSGQFNAQGAWKATLSTRMPGFDQDGKIITGVEKVFNPKVYNNYSWGLKWLDNNINGKGLFPQYFKNVGNDRVAVSAAEVPVETKLLPRQFKRANPGVPYTSPKEGAWTNPGAAAGPFKVKLIDGSWVTYSWYRFIDQPSFQQYPWSQAKKEKLQAFIEKIHASWPVDRDYMAPPTHGELVSLDPAIFVTPPAGMELGYVPIVTRQEAPR